MPLNSVDFSSLSAAADSYELFKNDLDVGIGSVAPQFRAGSLMRDAAVFMYPTVSFLASAGMFVLGLANISNKMLIDKMLGNEGDISHLARISFVPILYMFFGFFVYEIFQTIAELVYQIDPKSLFTQFFSSDFDTYFDIDKYKKSAQPAAIFMHEATIFMKKATVFMSVFIYDFIIIFYTTTSFSILANGGKSGLEKSPFSRLFAVFYIFILMMIILNLYDGMMSQVFFNGEKIKIFDRYEGVSSIAEINSQFLGNSILGWTER